MARSSESSINIGKRAAAREAPGDEGKPSGFSLILNDAMRHRTVDLDGPVHYIDFGGEGPPVLMVHGLGGSALNWAAVGPELSKNNHAAAIDLAGFGQTPLFRRSSTLGANANLVHRFAEEVLGEPVILI